MSKIHKIIITGNIHTPDEVIRQEIGLSEGDLLYKSDLENILERLKQLGLFSYVRVSVVPVLKKIDLIIEVVEISTSSKTAELIQSPNGDVGIGLGYGDINFLGSGNTIDLNAEYANDYYLLRASYITPEFNNMSFNVFNTETTNNYVEDDGFTTDTTGISIGYDIPFLKNVINTDLEYSENTLKCSDRLNGVNYELEECDSVKRKEIKLNTKWRGNTLNNPVYPTEGKVTDLCYDYVFSIDHKNYFNTRVKQTMIYPVNNNTLQLTGNLNFGKDIPFYKRYYGGGSGTMRGFGYNTLGPKYPNGTSEGGELSVFGSADFKFPTFLNGLLGGSGFIDVGNVYETTSFSKAKADELRASIGLGLYWVSPIGPIGFSLATPLIKKDGDIKKVFQLTLGNRF
uniref:POTRA domain-containing protein n=1 Tax=viral metagenome TaxID=1070528 RepID=A0A6C0EHY7_9ZZZZ